MVCPEPSVDCNQSLTRVPSLGMLGGNRLVPCQFSSCWFAHGGGKEAHHYTDRKNLLLCLPLAFMVIWLGEELLD
jgi:hypothetical protein